MLAHARTHLLPVRDTPDGQSSPDSQEHCTAVRLQSSSSRGSTTFLICVLQRGGDFLSSNAKHCQHSHFYVKPKKFLLLIFVRVATWTPVRRDERILLFLINEDGQNAIGCKWTVGSNNTVVPIYICQIRQLLRVNSFT